MGDVARLCKVAPRTAAKWFDQNLLRGWRLPGSTDRRVAPGTLREFMIAHGMDVGELDRIVFVTVLALEMSPELVAELRRRLPETEGWRVLHSVDQFKAGVIAAVNRPDLTVTLLQGETTDDLVERIREETAPKRKRDPFRKGGA